MTLDQVRKFAESRDLSVRQIALTKEAARSIIAEHEREVNAAIGEGLLFDLRDRDDSQHVSKSFARIAACLADEERVFGQTGLRTTAALIQAAKES